MTSCLSHRPPRLTSTNTPGLIACRTTLLPHRILNHFNLTPKAQLRTQSAKMSWMDSWSRPKKSAATPPPLYLTIGDSVPYCHSCGRVIGDRKKHGGSEVKYCSSRCRNSKPGPIDRKIEAAFAALLNGASPESLKDGSAAEEEAEKANAESKDGKKHKKKNSKTVKGEQRIIIDCQTVEEAVFNREKDPEKVYGRRKNRKARFVVEKPEDWRSVDMVDNPGTAAGPSQQQQKAASLTSEDDHDDDTLSETDSLEHEGGIVLEESKAPTSPSGKVSTEILPDTIEYGYGSGKIRPPQDQNDVNGSVGGEKGWAERTEETEDQKAKRREGQRRADEREMVRKAARRGCAFGFAVEGEEEKKKCEAVMKGSVVEASFAKGEWGVRWREKV
jgi:hypothetical protein